MIDDEGNVMLPRRVAWYDYQIHPARRYMHWAVRHLRKIPDDWRPYYRRMLDNELRATKNLNTPWDVFMAVSEGYRKGKWVLHKYGQEPEPKSIPHPYDDFWTSTTHEERVWAYRRSYQLKELQAIQRDDAETYGGVLLDGRDAMIDNVSKMYTTKAQSGNQVHSMDMPAPRESEIRDDDEMSTILMSSIEEDRFWNPATKAREYRESLERAEGLMAFEDEEEDDDESPADSGQRSPR